MTDQQPPQPQPPAGQPPAPQQPPAPYPGTPGAHPGYPAPGAQPSYPAPPAQPQPGYAQPAQPGYPQAQPGYPAPAYGAAGLPVYPAVPRGASSPDDLTLPLYGATFGQAISRFFKNYANFSGRASRSEYWWATLFTSLVVIVAYVLIAVTGGIASAQERSGGGVGLLAVTGVVGILLLIFSLGVLLPTLAISWRRLHDANFAGPFWFLTLTYIGALVVLVFTILPSNPQGQRFDRR